MSSSIFSLFFTVSGAGATWAWVRLFWEQLEPAVRHWLGKRWGIVIEWEHTAEHTGWTVLGEDQSKAMGVANAAMMVWMLGFFAPIMPVLGGVELGFISPFPGLFLVLSTLVVSLLAWRLQLGRLQRPAPKGAIRSPTLSELSTLPSPAKPPRGSFSTTHTNDGAASYLLAAGSLVASVLVSLALREVGGLEALAMIHLLGLILTAMFCSTRLSLLAATATALAFSYLFVPPSFGFAETEFKHTLTFVTMLVVAFVVSRLQARFRREERASHEAAFRAQTLYELERALSAPTPSDERMAGAVARLSGAFQAQLQLVLGRPSEAIDLSPEKVPLAEKAFCEQKLALDDEFPDVIWAPLVGATGCLGVIGLSGSRLPSPDQVWRELFEACSSRLASSIESAQLTAAAHRSELKAETERTRSSLLSAVSHDLKTPLSSILAAGTTLLERRGELSEQEFDELLSAIVLETERLSRLVHDLLSITRLESSTIVLTKSAESIEEIVTVAVQRHEAQCAASSIRCEFEKELPLIMVDPTLIEQVFINLLTNAVRHAGSDSPIEVRVSTEKRDLVVCVADHGPGVPPGERSRVFEKFYRSGGASSADGGIGLGLAICRSIVLAHGGTIELTEGPGGGALVKFTLPLGDSEAVAGT